MPPTRPTVEQARAIDHVAPKVAVDEERRVNRHFVHRTVLEHLVAEHIAAPDDADEAIGILLPHLWFDPDWQVAAPAAIAARNYERQGALLQRLLTFARHPATDTDVARLRPTVSSIGCCWLSPTNPSRATGRQSTDT
jgi:hypothetical protein